MPESASRMLARWLLGAFLASAGALHLTTHRDEFQAQVLFFQPLLALWALFVAGVVAPGRHSRPR